MSPYKDAINRVSTVKTDNHPSLHAIARVLEDESVTFSLHYPEMMKAKVPLFS